MLKNINNYTNKDMAMAQHIKEKKTMKDWHDGTKKNGGINEARLVIKRMVIYTDQLKEYQKKHQLQYLN